MKRNLIGYVYGKPVYRIAGGSEPTFQDQVQTMLAGNSDPVEESETENETEPIEVEEGGLSGFAKAYLETVPEAERPTIQTHLTKWDKDVQKKFQEHASLQSQYEPYQSVLEKGYDPEFLEQAVNVAQLLDTDPQQVFDALVRAGYGDQGVAAPPELDSDEDDIPEQLKPYIAKITELEQAISAMAQITLNQKEQSEQQELQERFSTFIEDLHTEHGDFDDDFVIPLMAEGIDPEDAIKRYNEVINKGIESRKAPKAPPILGSGGGLPTSRVDPSTLDSKGMINLTEQLLIAAQKEN